MTAALRSKRKTSFRRVAETNTRVACAPRIGDSRSASAATEEDTTRLRSPPRSWARQAERILHRKCDGETPPLQKRNRSGNTDPLHQIRFIRNAIGGNHR